MTTTWDFIEKSISGAGQQYNETNLTYDSLIDPDSGNTVYYDGIGIVSSWTFATKN